MIDTNPVIWYAPLMHFTNSTTCALEFPQKRPYSITPHVLRPLIRSHYLLERIVHILGLLPLITYYNQTIHIFAVRQAPIDAMVATIPMGYL